MSSLIDFDDDDFFAKGESSNTPEKNLDEIFGTSKESGSDNLDDIFGSNETKKQPLSEKQMVDLFGKAGDDEFDFFARGDENKLENKDGIQEIPKPPAGFDDSFAMLVQSNLDQSGSGKKSNDQSDAKTPDLDFLLEAQPAGMLDSTDDLMMFDPFADLPRKPRSPVLNPKVKKSTELKIDPSDEFFADTPLSPRLIQQLEPSQPPPETGSKMDDGTHDDSSGGLRKKRSMERSFEDLLHGLSDDEDLDIDDLVGDNTGYSTNLESILPSPGKSQPSDDTDKEFATPDRHFEPSNTFDLLTSTPNIETVEPREVKETEKFDDDFKFVDDFDDEDQAGIPEVRIEAPEGLISTPDSDSEVKDVREQDLDEQDMKSWEMVNQEDVDDVEETEEREVIEEVVDAEDDNNSALDGVVRRRRHPEIEVNGTDKRKEDSIDLSDVEDANQLDVDINKHKSSLSKRGSLALRRKPSRKNRRSLISEGEEVLFKDSTRPRSESLPNGDGGIFDQGDGEMSPPAKKTTPSFMMPLPGMAARPPHRSSLSSPDDDSEMTSEPKRTSKPPPGAFRLPAVAPRPSRPKSENLSKEISRPKDESQPSVFEKPVLRSVNKTAASSEKYDTVTSEIPSQSSATVSHGLRSHDDTKSPDLGRKGSEERDVTFEQPVLKSVSRTSKTEPSGEKDFTFEKPKLRSTPKPVVEKVERRTEDTGSYVKPALRSTPKPSLNRDTQKDDSVDLYAKEFDPSALRNTPRRSNDSSRNDTEKHAFEKPVLRSGNRTLNSEVVDNEAESTNSYDKQRCTRTHSDKTETEMNGFNIDSHTFEKPALRNTPAKVQREERGSFKKPTLRKSPEKQLSRDENKGFYDKPLLRKTENALSEEKTHISSSADKEYSSKFPETKLRKTETPSAEDKSKSYEKPVWLQAAKSKGSRALDAIQHKENSENHYLGKTEKPTPSWLEKPSLRKSPNPVPLQETSQNVGASQNQTGSMSSELSGSLSSLSDERRSSLTEVRTRRSGSSESTDSDSYKSRDRKIGKDSNYSPSWMRQLTPAKSSPSIPTSSSDEVPQWKKDLLQRTRNRKNFEAPPKWKDLISRKRLKKNSEGVSETPQKRVAEPSPEPEWKGNIQLRKVRQTPGPVKDSTPAEPEWKRAAEEKKARLRIQKVRRKD